MDLLEAYWTLEHIKCEMESKNGQYIKFNDIDDKVEALDIALRIMKPVIFREETD